MLLNGAYAYLCGADIEKKCTLYFLFTYFYFVEKGGGGSALIIISIFYTHHRIPNKYMMTINFDTITNNYEVIDVIKTVMKYLFTFIV
jgi:CRISPR/Cas system-associated endonuclease Cas3-HD